MKLYDKIIKICGTTNFMRGLNYQANKIKIIETDDIEKYRDAKFQIQSEKIDRNYTVKITVDKENKNLEKYTCTCPEYQKMDTCKHIAACILKYEDALFNGETINPITYQLALGKKILDSFYDSKTNTIKKQIFLDVDIEKKESYYQENYIKVNYKIGIDKMYTLNNKYRNFMRAYNKSEPYKISTKFTYDPQQNYFDKIDKQILDYNINLYQMGNYECIITEKHLNTFMETLKNKQFTMDGNQYNGYKEENPFDIELTKENENYLLSIKNISSFKQLTETASFIYDKKTLYKLDKNLFKLYTIFKENKIDNFMFSQKELGKFTGGLLSKLKEKIKLDESITEITIPTKPCAKLYFDFYYNSIKCEVKLNYGKEVNYFDKTPSIVRDSEYENILIEKLAKYKFKVNNNSFILDKTDEIGKFLEMGIYEISKDYEVFTSQKIKETKIIKKTATNVTFKIGQNGILSYNFNLDNIEQSELPDVLSSLKERKHYYKLKNGNIIDLNTDENIKKLESLTQIINIENKQLQKGEGQIPRYRAIYLDSLKENYQDILKTNDAFNELIRNFKAYKDKEISLPKEELKILRDYQLIGVKWLYNIYKTGFGCILADEMGLGKSIQLIYLIKLIIKENKNAKILIVAPTSLIYNWKKEFDKFGPELNYKVIAENKIIRQNELNNLNNTNILITSYGLIRNDLEKYQKISFDLIAIDEAQNIKNPSTGISKAIKKLKSNVKISLTGTPIENSLMELWSIFDFIMPGYLAGKEKFQNKYSIKNIENKEVVDRLNKQIQYFILRRKKKDVVKDLPAKIENNIYVDLESKQKKIYAAEVEKTKETLDEMIAQEGFTKSKLKILQLLTKLRQICISPALEFENYKGESSKINELLKIATEAKQNGHKMLIFTTYRKALELIIPKLNKKGITTYYIDGTISSKKRMELVEKFNKDTTDAFIITLKAGGTGLNLTSATVVIHLDLWWNPQVENQATDRAHRIGQKNTVEVIRLITKGTIEEKILELQNKKRKLAEMLIDNEKHTENQFSKLTEEDIKMLLAIDNE
ncbi:MAG: DEAD/DEAH box helicase [Bacilli bacterium]|nr:DEAD/DEAH box helicase [Bacilli bacterium]